MRGSYLLLILIFFYAPFCKGQFEDYVDHYIKNEQVTIHYVTKGKGPTILFLHGFPDFWFTWKYQMDNLSTDYQVVGMDLRAYNQSTGPQEPDGYRMEYLMSDVVAVIRGLKVDKIVLVGNDWGGAIAWQVATHYPEIVKALVACNIPHPISLTNYLKDHPQTASYVKDIEAKEAINYWTPEQLMKSAGVVNHQLSSNYQIAFEISDVQGMLNYYKVSYPKTGTRAAPPQLQSVRKIKCPVLMIHGLDDTAFPPGTLNDHWLWVENLFTLHTLPNVGHFVQRDAPEQVLHITRHWLNELD